ncbi:hypothetical protein A7982_12916 [Minicystis rosea]|nr:hypothetical protein A7982_12916 [Minicystis rosea]
MKGASWKTALVGAAAAVITMAAPAEAANEGLALRRVLLSSGGVGYFEYEAKISGNADLPLTVRFDQVDDVLKSVVVYDDQGGAGNVTLPGKATLDEAFRDLPFDPSALASEPELLNALRGADVVVRTADGGAQQGNIISVTAETTELPDDGGQVVRHRLSITRDGVIYSYILEDVIGVRFVDEKLRAQIDSALNAVLTQKDRGRRTITVHATGQGDRTVRVGYVVAVPLWKSTYRLTLPTDAAPGPAELVGLAVVENQSGVPWSGVDLTLVSGNPVTFHQALYQAYYVDRPEIPVEVVGRVLPRLDEGAVAVVAKHRDASAAYGVAMAGGFAMPEAAPAYAPGAPPLIPAPSPKPPAVESVEDTTQVIFHLSSPVTIAAGEDALITILDRDIPAQRVSVYQPDIDAHHPIASVQLENDTETGLPPGVITTYERGASHATTYLGDARLASLPAGEKRFVSFGVDQKVRIDREERDAQIITVASISGGVLRLTRMARHTSDFTIVGAAHESRTVILEEPRFEGFDLVEPTGATVESTATHHRVRVDVKAGATVSISITQQKPIDDRIAIADLSSETLGVYASASELPVAVRDALHRIATLRAKVDEKVRAANDIQAEIGRITAEQARIRENLKVVPAGTPLHQRYLTDLGEQEDKLDALQTQLTNARRALDDARKALAELIRTLTA